MESLCPYYWVFPKTVHGGQKKLTDMMFMKTKDIHDESDKLVMSKFTLSLSNKDTYFRAIGMFYLVYKDVLRILELNMDTDQRLASLKPFIGPLLTSRVQRFEFDLEHHFGPLWRNHLDHNIVEEYLLHLSKVKTPILLVPYFYHLSLALLAGGQTIRKLVNRAFFDVSTLVFEYPGIKRFEMKAKFKERVNALLIEPNEIGFFLQESKHVFELNNSMVSRFQVNSSIAADFVQVCVIILASPEFHSLAAIFFGMYQIWCVVIE